MHAREKEEEKRRRNLHPFSTRSQKRLGSPSQNVLMLGFYSVVLLLTSGSLVAETRVTVSSHEIGRVSPLLFGQMLERCEQTPGRKGESGAEVLMDGTGAVRADARALLEQMQIPVVRFPGGGIVDSPEALHWRDLVGPTEPLGERAKNRSLGYKEFFAMAAELNWKTILGVNFWAIVEAPRDDASLHKAILESCGVAAYATAPAGARLPDGMPDWGATRASDGHPQPWRIDYLQIGNEWPTFISRLLNKPGANVDADVKWIGKCIRETSKTLREIRPGVPVIVDGVLWRGEKFEGYARALERVYSDPEVRAAMDIMTVHVYRPWQTSVIEKNGQAVDATTLDPREVWQAMQAVPQINDQGLSVLTGTPESMPGFALAQKLGMPLAITEWNWNGGGRKGSLLQSFFAKGFGVGGFLHAFFRNGQVVLACQSMLAGDGWGINSIRVPAKGVPYLHPSAQIVRFYQQHHGDRVLAADLQNGPVVEQPVRVGEIEPRPRLALLDGVATRDEAKVYVHLINRSFDQALPVEVEGTDGLKLGGTVEIHRLSGTLENNPDIDAPGKDRIATSRETATTKDGAWHGELPARTITILVYSLP